MRSNTRNILVTGGCGFIGSHTSLALLNKGFRLIIFDSLVNSSEKVISKILRLSKINESKKSSYIQFIKGDIRDKNLLDSIFKEYNNSYDSIEAVIHFAGLKSVLESKNSPMKYWDVNVKGTINLLDIMEKYKCFNFIWNFRQFNIPKSFPCNIFSNFNF